MECQLTIVRTEQKKEKPALDKLGFGVHFTDHMFTMDYTEGKGWHDPQIVPHAPLTLDPAAMVLHYGQAIFEGMKAYRNKAGKVLLFRPEQNFKRMNRSLERMSMPQVDGEFMVDALKQLVALEKEWIPAESGMSLYIRPFVIATEPCFGVRPSHTYKLIIVLSPVGAYYANGMEPVKIYVENKYVRAVRGGTGNAKVAGNYAGALKAQAEAKEKGYEQVLWLDGVENKYIEEVGSMNVFFKVGEEVWTPALNGSILEGITRDSTIHLLKDWGIPVVEKRISVEELYEAYTKGQLEEAFGTGTAAVISPVGDLNWNGHQMILNGEKTGPLTTKLYETMTGIQYGEKEDKFGWSVEVSE
ncbi:MULTISPECIES: branched-chain amino acid aminotransferase [Brevibacillus]|jgi:branched-chain amino acid aminotransferase|uniref:Branched-chain-amino-acid aminotransferase n=2 Tax=Bacteria TaxID=2 RepID=A0A4Y3PU36_BREPA|nr:MULTISPECIES: branched-chain amino acid aminotransferase [Brevibacillus]MBU8712989.1 branched-chain amino acid aminotransferase [Brevibacillus parabrevis]MDH6348508.1 branched-chain amino acid aminotransferase [Brevibacillus sp. 1238]MDR5002345.1 branched-chain amino acid aminotransferase [Brevibacillus parabrevis]MED2256402.1 branched-chain amino acid aminotransferase [Brevibacillus parabrevis]NRQ53017.1 branched-chain amino acid aminotransferase [Brevibacillus sp. HD1.4A]